MSNDLTLIPLNKLVRSCLNVRRTGPEAIEDLAASIAVHGLLPNLTVTKKTTNGKGRAGADNYEVVAGGQHCNPWQSRRGFPRITLFHARWCTTTAKNSV